MMTEQYSQSERLQHDMKRKWAEREGVRWECDIQMPKACGINEFDLCVLFGNLLDNALEAYNKMSGLRYSEAKAER